MDIFKTKEKTILMRHEEKYILSNKQLILLENRIKNLLPKDHNQNNESYKIRSLYFDTISDRLLEESIAGVNHRYKFRIRTYNHSDKLIRLEKKTSINNLKNKTSCLLSKDLVMQIIKKGFIPSSFLTDNIVLKEFYALQKEELLMPKIIVDYDRSAYINEIGNVRITFDKNISGSYEIDKFFDKSIIKFPVLLDDKCILEVKYDGIFPGYIAQALDLGNLQRISFSKYSLSRNLIENNGISGNNYEF